MKPIYSGNLTEALRAISVPTADRKIEAVATNPFELSVLLGSIIIDLESQFQVPDPSGRYKFGFLLHPKRTFEGGKPLFSNGKVLYFASEGGAPILFVSEYAKGRVGIVHSPPDDVSKYPYHDLDRDDATYWNLEFVEWLERYREVGTRLFEEF